MRRILTILLIFFMISTNSVMPSGAQVENSNLYTFLIRGENGRINIVKGSFSDLMRIKIAPGSVRTFSKVNKVHILETSVSQPDPESKKQWALTLLEGDTLYNQNARGAGVTIAVIDTGVDKKHKEFSDRITKGFDIYDTAGDGSNDNNGHGTHVAGIIAAGRNGFGTEGLASESIIMPIKVLDATGYGDDADVGKGLIWAVDHGAQVANMSLGGSEPNSVLADAILYARSKGVSVVVAAGNNGSMSPVIYPASDQGAFAVGASGGDNKAAFFSSQGAWVDIVAPGVSILSTWPGDSYRVESGTSMATPYVSASIAVVSSYLKIPAIEAEDLLLKTCTDIPLGVDMDGRDNATGCGMVDPFWAIGHTKPRLLKDRNNVPISQMPADVTAPSIDLPKLIAPTLPPLPTPQLPKITLPSPTIPQPPKYPTVAPSAKAGDLIRLPKRPNPVVKKKVDNKNDYLTFYSYYSLNNTVVDVSYNGEPLANRTVVLVTSDFSREVRTNYLGRVITESRVKVFKVILKSS